VGGPCQREVAVKCSVCIAAYDKPWHLDRVLASIMGQDVPYEWELIVVDDGSPTDEVAEVCSHYGKVDYVRIDRVPGYRNPAVARNVAYRRARGEVVIAQSDDVVHVAGDTIWRLVEELTPGTFVIATVTNVDRTGRPCCSANGVGFGDRLTVYTSPQLRRPLFFLGSLYRRDLYAVGGNDEEFTAPGREDVWFALCLVKGLGLRPTYSAVAGHHLQHQHTTSYASVAAGRQVFARKCRQAMATGVYQAAGGPWPLPAQPLAPQAR